MNQCQLILMSPRSFELKDFIPKLSQALEVDNIVAFILRQTDSQYIQELLPLVKKCNLLFLINDNVKMAENPAIDGIHLSFNKKITSESVNNLRLKLGKDKIIGVECQTSKDLAMVAGEQGADYICFDGTINLDLCKWWQDYTEVPCVTYGDINWSNYAKAVKHSQFLVLDDMIWSHSFGPIEALKEINEQIIGE